MSSDVEEIKSIFDKITNQNNEMFAMLSTIACFSTDTVYAWRAEELVREIRKQDLEMKL